jgi:hypothetical protein
VQVLADAMPEDWRAAEAYLRAKHPSRWGRRERHALDHSVSPRPPERLSAEQQREELEEMIQMATGALAVMRGPEAVRPPTDE